MKQWQRALEEREPRIAWAEALGQVCELATRHLRDGEAIVDLRDVELMPRPRHLLKDLVEAEGHTNFHADGGSGKSTLAMGIAVSVSSSVNILDAEPSVQAPVLVIDWETSAETHAETFRAICTGAGLDYRDLPIHYLHMSAGLIESAPMIRKRILEVRAGLAIFDPLGYARNGDPESAELTIRMFNTFRSLRIPTVGTDHVTKNGADKGKAFGSVYTHNASRRTWGMVKTSEEGSDRITVALTNYKANRGRLARRRGYHIDFENDEDGVPLVIRFTPCDVRDVPALASNLSQKDHLIGILRANNRAMTIEDLSAALEAEGMPLKDTIIRAVLNRHKDAFSPVPDGRIVRWGLLSKVHANG